MRVLFATTPEKTIFMSMVPLAWALRTAGHEVRFASQPKFADTITQAGLTAVPVGRDSDLFRTARLTPELLEEARAGLHAPWDVAEDPAKARWDSMLTGYQDAVQEGHKPENFPMISSLCRFAREWRPDLVVWDPLTYAGPIAAKACGAAHARLLFGVDVFGVAREHFNRLLAARPEGDRPDPLAEWLDAYARKYGGEDAAYTEDMATGHFTLDPFPSALQKRAEGLHYEPLRYVAYNGAATVPGWLWKHRGPRIGITLGLSATDLFSGYHFGIRDVLESLADLEVEVVATVSDEARERLGSVPANARLVPYVPLHALAPTCDMVVHHAGPGTLATVAEHGVPQLSLPYSFDEPLFASALTDYGAGLHLMPGETSGAAVRERVLRLLEEPGFRGAAEQLGEEFTALPSPNALVPRLEKLTNQYRPG